MGVSVGVSVGDWLGVGLGDWLGASLDDCDWPSEGVLSPVEPVGSSSRVPSQTASSTAATTAATPMSSGHGVVRRRAGAGSGAGAGVGRARGWEQERPPA